MGVIEETLAPYVVQADNATAKFATLEAAMLYVARLIVMNKEHVMVMHPFMKPIQVLVMK